VDTVIKIIGIAIVVIAVVFLIKPGLFHAIMGFVKRGKRAYFMGLVRLALAVVFLLGARECDLTWLIAVFGIVFLLSGLLIFMLGAEKVGSIINWYQEQSTVLLRVLVLIMLAVGAVIIYAA
jgi:hypothetical protein